MKKVPFAISPKELSLIRDTDFLLSKAVATDKIFKLLAITRDAVKDTIVKENFSFPKEADISLGKISKGENYRQLPFIILDYPKLFSKNAVFAFRHMFWWGNYFSITFHLEGEVLEKYRERLIKNSKKMKNNGLYICIHSTPWEYHFGQDNYKTVDLLIPSELIDILTHKPFIKISNKLDLKHWKQLPELAVKFFRLSISLLH